MTEQFGKIKREVISEVVAQRIISLIMKDSLKPGDKLPTEREMAQYFGVGRPAVREALRALHMMNVIGIRYGDGVYVGSLEPSLLMNPFKVFMVLNSLSLDALFETRMIFETESIRLSAQRMTEDKLAELESLIETSYQYKDDVPKFLEIDIKIHSCIIESCGNPLLVALSKSINELGRASRELTAIYPEVRSSVLHDHAMIAKALRMRDQDGAVAAMRNHLLNVRKLAQLDSPAIKDEFGRKIKEETLKSLNNWM